MRLIISPSEARLLHRMDKFKILLCLFLFSDKCLPGSESFRFDYKYFPSADGWLKYHSVPANWHEARLRCHLEGAKLTSPLDSGLASAISQVTEPLDCAVFTGIHSTFSRGDFHSVEGVPLSRIPHTWATNEPDNYRDEESCVVALKNGSLADVRCQDTYAYTCYRRGTKNILLSECGTVDRDYKLERTGSCYKFHRVARTWSRAYMTCAAEGGHLAIINSDDEAKVIKEIFARNPASSMLGHFWKDVAYVGFHDWNEHGEWLTIEGQTLQEAGYSKFSPGEPNNATTGEYCGAVYRSAMFDDLWCDKLHPFICEKKPDSLLPIDV